MIRIFMAILGFLFMYAANGDVLQYEPVVVRLDGVLVSAKGKTPDEEDITFPAIKLKAPVSVEGDPGDEFNESEDDVRLMQLMLSDELMRKFKSMKGRTVVIAGTLMHSHTGHHYTKVLIDVKHIYPE